MEETIEIVMDDDWVVWNDSSILSVPTKKKFENVITSEELKSGGGLMEQIAVSQHTYSYTYNMSSIDEELNTLLNRCFGITDDAKEKQVKDIEDD